MRRKGEVCAGMRRVVSAGKKYLLNLILLLMCWGGFYRSQLANSDTLWGNIDPGATLISRLSNFRWLGYAGDAFSYYVLHIYPYDHQMLSIILFLAVLALALLFLQSTFAPLFDWERMSGRGKLAFWLVTSLCFVNVLSAEFFYFTESFLIFKASLLLAMMGCWLMSRRCYAGSCVLLFLAPMFYQMASIYAALVLCALAYIEEKAEPSKRLAKKLIFYVTAALLGFVVNYGTGKWIVKWISRAVGYDIIPGKSVSIGSVSDSISNLTRGLRDLYESSLGLMMPVWLPLLFSVVTSGIVIAMIYRLGTRQMLELYLLYKVGSFLLMFCIEIISPMGEFVCRVVCPFYTMQAMNALIALYWICRGFTQGAKGGCELWDKILLVAAGGYVLVQVFFAQIIIANRLLSETLDIQYAESILEYIDEYETENGIEITEASFCVDSNYSAYYSQVNYCHTAINYRIAGEATYSLVETVAGWSGRHVGRGSMSQEVYEEYFAGRDWDSFQPEEQIVVLDGKMYCCVY